MNEAGWEPVTHARVTPAEVGIERWGNTQFGSIYFSLLNRSDKAVSAEVSVDGAALRLPSKIEISDLFGSTVSKQTSVAIALAPGQATVLSVTPSP